MRARITCLATVILGILAGCYSEPGKESPPGPVDPWTWVSRRGEVDLDISYLAACRDLLEALRDKYGDPTVLHDVWPDIQEAILQISKVHRGNNLLRVNIRGTGPQTCHVTILCADYYWSLDAWPVIEKSLKSEIQSTAVRIEKEMR